MAKKMYEETRIAAVAEKIRELTGMDKRYTTKDMPEGVEEVAITGYLAGLTTLSTPLHYNYIISLPVAFEDLFKRGENKDQPYTNSFRTTDFSRTPEVGDIFSLIFTDKNQNKVYSFAEITDPPNDAGFTPFKVVNAALLHNAVEIEALKEAVNERIIVELTEHTEEIENNTKSIEGITESMGVANGIATLDDSGHVPSTQLPSYVDSVTEGYVSEDRTKFYEDSAKTKEIKGESGKIYLDVGTLRTYRWGGTLFAEISESLALGENVNTAFPGDKGKVAYDHSQVTMGNPHNVKLSDLGINVSANDLNNVTSKANKSEVPSKTENWTFTLEDGSTVTKAVYVG